jgi:hypothetical protein
MILPRDPSRSRPVRFRQYSSTSVHFLSGHRESWNIAEIEECLGHAGRKCTEFASCIQH